MILQVAMVRTIQINIALWGMIICVAIKLSQIWF